MAPAGHAFPSRRPTASGEDERPLAGDHGLDCQPSFQPVPVDAILAGDTLCQHHRHELPGMKNHPGRQDNDWTSAHDDAHRRSVCEGRIPASVGDCTNYPAQGLVIAGPGKAICPTVHDQASSARFCRTGIISRCPVHFNIMESCRRFRSTGRCYVMAQIYLHRHWTRTILAKISRCRM